MPQPLVELTPAGPYCAAGDFYFDPWQPVPRAVITHLHGDHARRGSDRYLLADEGRQLARLRLGEESQIDTLAYGERLRIGPVTLSLHPAGHVLGSSQVRLESGGQVWCFSGDYKRQHDPTCHAFELVPCDVFITETTFGLPVYRWPEPASVIAQIDGWWQANRAAGKASVLFGYALGKAQRLLAELADADGRVFTHGAVHRLNQAYRASGVHLPSATYVGEAPERADFRGSLILAPPSAQGTVWLRRFGAISTGMASGWMRIRGRRRWRALDRGFVLSDHVDWVALMETIRATGAERIYTTHGYAEVVAHRLRELGYEAAALQTPYRGEPLGADNGEEPEAPGEPPGADASTPEDA